MIGRRTRFFRAFAIALTFLCVFLTILFSQGMTYASAAEEVNPTIPVVRVENKTIHRGQTFEVDVYLDSNPGLISLLLDLEYDKTVMELVGFTRGDALSTHTFTTTNVDTGEGYLTTPFRLLWDGRMPDASVGKLVTLTFKSKVDAEIGDYPITINYDRKNTHLEYEVPCDVQIENGVVTFIKGEYSVKYLNYDGTVLFEKDYNADAIPSYEGQTPTRPTDECYSYVFKGWRGVVSDADDVICYEADYELIAQIYQVFFYVDGEYFNALECAYGEFINMTKIPSKKNYVFDGWYSDEEMTQKISASQMPAHDVILYGRMKFNIRENPTPQIVLSVDRMDSSYVYVAVDILRNPSISGLILTLDYDRGALTFEGFERGEAFAGLQFDHTNVDQGYSADPFRFYWEHSSNTLETGRLLILKFKINEEAEDGVYSVTMTYEPTTDAVYVDESGNLSYTKLDIVGAQIPIGKIHYWNEKIENVADIIAQCPEGMPADTVLRIEVATANLNISKEHIQSMVAQNTELKAAYTIELLRGDERVQPNGMITVKIKLSEAQMLCTDLYVCYVGDDNNLTVYDSRVEDGYIVFETDHLSCWAIVGNELDININQSGIQMPDNSHVIIIAFALLAIACMAFCLIIIAQKKNWQTAKSNEKGENNT